MFMFYRNLQMVRAGLHLYSQCWRHLTTTRCTYGTLLATRT